MTPQSFCNLARRLMQHPTAPYHEYAVRDEAEKICAEHNLPFKRDPFGNLLVHLRPDLRRRPLVLAAHLDHPGFDILQQISPGRWLAQFRGGVGDPYFRQGTRLRLMPGRLRALLGRRKHRTERIFELKADTTPKTLPTFAVWDLPDFKNDGGQIRGRACDDLIGAAATLATLIDLRRGRTARNVVGVLSRAEEVGFHGALALAASRALPQDSFIISLETSRELPGVKMGNGVILRVGDRASIFDSEGTRFLGEVAADLNRKTGFRFQRALMSGGTCEATAYQEFGFRCAALCIALGNYHNCAANSRIKAEHVSVADACSMVDLLAAAAKQMPNWNRLVGRLPKRLHRLLRAARTRLRKTAGNR
jgi:putative aminopeptidase FrvX